MEPLFTYVAANPELVCGIVLSTRPHKVSPCSSSSSSSSSPSSSSFGCPFKYLTDSDPRCFHIHQSN
ncbi:hypothetical protein OIU79_012267 [Salix purpurea]|uniref:Uncharacterized protein n=1 Tax=Salix purpurea TaxID=77065 RepID=A0A9Q0Q2S1_SALPP|nr:hypothetical protein OIU79_012267 [Salix purpurea]